MSAGLRPLECAFSLMHSASGRGGSKPGFSLCGSRPEERAKRKAQLRSALCLMVRSPLQEQTRAWSAQMSNPIPQAGQWEGEDSKGMRSRRKMAMRNSGPSSTVRDSLQGVAWSQAPEPSADISCVCAFNSTGVCGERRTSSSAPLSSLAHSTFCAGVPSSVRLT